jgi:plastocyanin
LRNRFGTRSVLGGMNSRFTGSLVVCVAAAGVAVGALALEPGDSPAPAAGIPSSSVPGGSGYGTADGGTVGGTGNGTVAIRDFTFAASSVAPAAPVTVDNADGVSHTVTAASGEFDSGDVPGGATGTFQAPGAPGSYQFFCQIHPGMTGTLTVG